VRYFLALTTHARLAAIEEWRRLRCAPSSPVPVRLRAIVPTLGLQRTFVCPGEVPVPGEEVACSMDAQSIFHVDRNKVIVTGLGSRICCRAEFGRSLGETCNGSDVCFLFIGGYVTPVIDVSTTPRKGEVGEHTILDALVTCPLYMSWTWLPQRRQQDVLWWQDPTPHLQRRE
jgi:hypothetical protein